MLVVCVTKKRKPLACQMHKYMQKLDTSTQRRKKESNPKWLNESASPNNNNVFDANHILQRGVVSRQRLSFTIKGYLRMSRKCSKGLINYGCHASSNPQIIFFLMWTHNTKKCTLSLMGETFFIRRRTNSSNNYLTKMIKESLLSDSLFFLVFQATYFGTKKFSSFPSFWGKNWVNFMNYQKIKKRTKWFSPLSKKIIMVRSDLIISKSLLELYL